MFKNRTVIIFSSLVFIACILIIYLLIILGNFDRSPEIREESSVSLLDRICLYGDDKELFRYGNYFSSGSEYVVIDGTGTYSLYHTRILNNYNDCLGLELIGNETVVLQCPGKRPEQPGCFEVFNSIPNSNDTEKVENICLGKNGDEVITPNNSTVYLFHCIMFAVVSAPDVTPRRL